VSEAARGPAQAADQPPIGEYALIGDGRAAALVSRTGSIDWCCMPRLDCASCFGRLLDWRRGGYCMVGAAEHGFDVTRGYLDGTLVLETRLAGPTGEARILDCFLLGEEGGPELLRVVDGERGRVELELRIAARFDYGDLPPWLRRHDDGVFTAVGGGTGLVIATAARLDAHEHDLHGRCVVRAGERVRLSIAFVAPEDVEAAGRRPARDDELDRRLQRTIDLWREWSAQASFSGPRREGVVRSAVVLKALANPRTGAIAAAATTSLPESPGGELNWDYRFSWVRDAVFTLRSLTEVGFVGEADAFRRFVERSAAASVDGLQIMYGVGGERRLPEATLDELEGYRGARPVRIGNAASTERQHDVYGHLLEQASRWHERGHVPEDDYWRFLVDVVDAAAANWRLPDSGIWESRDAPRHFVHSKVMCWTALDRGITLADHLGRDAPVERWRREREEVRAAVERDGWDAERGVFVQAFGSERLDAAVLLLPRVGFVAWDDERMVRTVDAIRDGLDADGLLLRYRSDASPPEGAFLACSFWLAECLARQGRRREAEEVFDRAAACGSDLGLLAEECDPTTGELLGNFPQGLSHLSYISAAVALAES
jgi:GH15 family glucan-1,4-alpha-glucosidase